MVDEIHSPEKTYDELFGILKTLSEACRTIGTSQYTVALSECQRKMDSLKDYILIEEAFSWNAQRVSNTMWRRIDYLLTTKLSRQCTAKAGDPSPSATALKMALSLQVPQTVKKRKSEEQMAEEDMEHAIKRAAEISATTHESWDIRRLILETRPQPK